MLPSTNVIFARHTTSPSSFSHSTFLIESKSFSILQLVKVFLVRSALFPSPESSFKCHLSCRKPSCFFYTLSLTKVFSFRSIYFSHQEPSLFNQSVLFLPSYVHLWQENMFVEPFLASERFFPFDPFSWSINQQLLFCPFSELRLVLLFYPKYEAKDVVCRLYFFNPLPFPSTCFLQSKSSNSFLPFLANQSPRLLF